MLEISRTEPKKIELGNKRCNTCGVGDVGPSISIVSLTAAYVGALQGFHETPSQLQIESRQLPLGS